MSGRDDPEAWAKFGQHLDIGPAVSGGGRRRTLNTKRYRGDMRDITVWTGAASGTALDLEASGHASPRRVPPRDLAELVRRGNNA